MLQDILSLIHVEAMLQILLAAFLGAAIGLERERWKKNAGFRTYMLICIGSAIFAMIGIYGSSVVGSEGLVFEPTIVIQAVAVGIGFLGSGLIINKQGHTEGLTTAVGAWTVAAIGVAVGFKLYFIAFFATIVCLIVLNALRFLEAKYLD